MVPLAQDVRPLNDSIIVAVPKEVGRVILLSLQVLDVNLFR